MLDHVSYSSLDRICGSYFQVQLWYNSAAVIWLTPESPSATCMCIERFGCSQHHQSLHNAMWKTEDGKDASAALTAGWIDFVEAMFLHESKSLKKQSFSDFVMVYFSIIWIFKPSSVVALCKLRWLYIAAGWDDVRVINYCASAETWELWTTLTQL